MSDATPRELLLLRHGKSSWDSDAASDFERPLAKRGLRDAPRMGRYLEACDLLPQRLITSPARRARQTARRVADVLGLEEDRFHLDERIYDASAGDLVRLIHGLGRDLGRVLLVGHNPGLEQLACRLAQHAPDVPANGKLLPTCALAHFELDVAWPEVEGGCARLLGITRPKELAEQH